jgi:peptidoglycan LD-endopeptidase LytH
LRSFVLGVVSGVALCLFCFAFWAIRPGSREPQTPRAGIRDALDEPPEIKASPAPSAADYEVLGARQLAFPIESVDRGTLLDNFEESRGSLRHEALDIVAPRGTPVVAVDDGTARKLFTSVRGGLTVYQFDPDENYCYYYAHLDRYAEGLAEGRQLRKGERVGYVGTTGNAPPQTPHLHFTIFKLGPDKRWWEGVPLNPYPLWTAALPR